jgi:chromate transporter
LARVLAARGNSTIGGGTATVVELERELIDRRGWISRAESRAVYAIARLTPGTNLLAYCLGMGWRLAGPTGAIIAVLAVSLPGAIGAVALTWLFERGRAYPIFTASLDALLAAAIAIMFGAIWAMMRPFFYERGWERALGFAAAGFALAVLTHTSPLTILVGSALLGALVPGRTTS